MGNNTYKEYIKPVVVLVAICFVVTLALSFTYGITEPKIEARAKSDADKARTQLIKEADGFKEVKGDLAESDDGDARVTECYEATNGAGSVMTVETKSFGGVMKMMVGVDKEGKITGIVISSHDDTPGVGTKDMTDEYLGQYKGLTELTDPSVKKESQIDYISGASVTGQAIHSGIEAAVKQAGKGGE